MLQFIYWLPEHLHRAVVYRLVKKYLQKMASCPAERNWDSFFQEENAPSDLIQRKTLVREFSERNLGEGRCVVLVTVGLCKELDYELAVVLKRITHFSV